MIALTLLTLAGCGKGDDTASTGVETWLDAEVVDSLSMEAVRTHVDVLADDGYRGRVPGSPGHAAARDYLAGELADIGLTPLGTDGYIHAYETEPRAGFLELLDDGSVAEVDYDTGYNLVGLIPGSDPERAGEHIVIMAHYDHLGADEEGAIYNGAFDDAAGVSLLLEIARTLVSQEVPLGRSVLFLITDEEEAGLNGAKEWLADALIPGDEIVFGVSVDPVGRGVLPDYWPLVLMGLERSPTLQERWRELSRYSEVDVVFVHRDIIPIFASDQDNFYELEDPVPAVWFTSPGMAFYHTTDDTPETIDYRSLRAQGRFLLQAVAWFAEDSERYPYEGAPALAPEHAEEVIPLVDGMIASEYITGGDESELQDIRDQLQDAVDQDSLEPLEPLDGFFYYAIYTLVFAMPAEHVGEIPPPFPEEG